MENKVDGTALDYLIRAQKRSMDGHHVKPRRHRDPLLRLCALASTTQMTKRLR